MIFGSFSSCSEIDVINVDVLSRAEGKDALSATDCNSGGYVQDILKGKVLRTTVSCDVILGIEKDGFFPENGADNFYVGVKLPLLALTLIFVSPCGVKQAPILAELNLYNLAFRQLGV